MELNQNCQWATNISSVSTFQSVFKAVAIYFSSDDFTELLSLHHSIDQHGNRISHFAHAVHSHHLFPPIGDAAYHQRVRVRVSRVINVSECEWVGFNVPEDWAMDTGNMHKKYGKDCTWFQRYPSCWTDTQTDTETYSPQYFTATPVGEVNIELCVINKVV